MDCRGLQNQILALPRKTQKRSQLVGIHKNWSDGFDSLFLSLSLHFSVFYIPLPHCSCLSLFSPIQLLHRLNPEPSSLLLSIHSCSSSAESLPGVALLRTTGGDGEGRTWKNKEREKKRERPKETPRQGEKEDRHRYREGGSWA